MLTLYGPHDVVIGGSAARYLDLYSRSIETSLAKLDGWIPQHRIVKTMLDDYGGAIGSARLSSIVLLEAPI